MGIEKRGRSESAIDGSSEFPVAHEPVGRLPGHYFECSRLARKIRLRTDVR